MTTVLNVPADLNVVPEKSRLLDAYTESHGGGWPSKFTSNSQKEEVLLEYVEDFRRQFVQVFPNRRPLLLCPKNEAGVRKFVCTTVRPTQLPYANLYKLKECAEFVSDFLHYLPMDVPTQLPDLLPSPTTTIKLRAGDSLDFATLLCSLLRGSGFNAYVVSGYAPKSVTLCDETLVECPFIGSEEEDFLGLQLADEKAAQEQASTTRKIKKDEAKEEEKERYPNKYQPQHKSEYVKMRKNEIREETEKARRDEEKRQQYSAEIPRDPLEKDRVHCWVLIMKGRRDVTSNLYVEPTTGTIFEVEKSPYAGIESVWNEVNYWANVQDPEKVNPQNISFDLTDTKSWEYVLIDERKPEDKGDGLQQFESNETQAADGAKELLPEDDILDERDILDAPISWCGRIQIKRADFRSRYPTRNKIVHYSACTMEKFSEYSENGLVTRVTRFQTVQCITPVEVREEFMHRKDRLIRRTTWPLQERVHEVFAPGNGAEIIDSNVDLKAVPSGVVDKSAPSNAEKSGLKDFIQVGTEKRFFTFHKNARVDGMVIRHELIGQKVIEEFEERDDHLVFRSIVVDPTLKQVGRQGYSIALGRSSAGEQPVRKVTEKFARDTSKHAEEDVRKRTHLIADGLIKLDYHYGNSHIVASSQLVDKNDRPASDLAESAISRSSIHRAVDGKEFKERTAGEQRELLQRLLIKEKELMSHIKDREKNLTELVTELEKQRLNVVLEKTLYDLAAEQALDKEQEEEDNSEADRIKADYLSAFLAQFPPGKKLTKRQILQAKDECLANLKERLLERANIIQAHLDQENQALHQRRALFKRQSGTAGALEADEEFTKFYEESAFRIDILRARLARHQEIALDKYIKLDAKLNTDPRLQYNH